MNRFTHNTDKSPLHIVLAPTIFAKVPPHAIEEEEEAKSHYGSESGNEGVELWRERWRPREERRRIPLSSYERKRRQLLLERGSRARFNIHS